MAVHSVSEFPQKMRAVSYSAYGGGGEGLEHVELPIPAPKKNEVLVKVEACSMDWKVHMCCMNPVLPCRAHVPGSDIAGMVVSVGPGVTTFVPGDKVVSCLGKAGGGMAEYAIAPITTTIKRRSDVTPAVGVAMGISGFAALQSVRNSGGIAIDHEGSKKTTKNVLIRAATGGVGLLAVQIAKLGGAHVTATCAPGNFSLLKSLGADEVLALGDENQAGQKYDVVINSGAHVSFRHYKPSLASSGFVIDLTPSCKNFISTAVHPLRYFPFVPIPNTADMYLLFNLLHLGRIRPVVDSSYPLAKAGDAWARCVDGDAVGTIVVTIAHPPS